MAQGRVIDVGLALDPGTTFGETKKARTFSDYGKNAIFQKKIFGILTKASPCSRKMKAGQQRVVILDSLVQ